MYYLNEFCKERKIPNKMRDAFTAYCKASLAEDYKLGAGETLTGILLNMNEKEVMEMWVRYINDLKNLLSENHIP